uniref:Mitochondrial glutamate carrier 1-like n=1 Tax=Panagrellus redivivus TaxID=6233 RepID=A0A7E5A049_PANRE
MTQPQKKVNYPAKILNGGIAGIVGVTCVFPIDLVKTRLQNQRVSADGKVEYKGILDCAKKTWQRGGTSTFAKVGSLYSGSAVNILLITPEKAIKLVANDFFRAQLAQPGEKSLSSFRGMIAGGLAGLLQITVTTPMELLKIQMQQSGGNESAWRLAKELYQKNGIAGLYRGLISTIGRDVPFSMIYFPLFAKFDSLGPRKSDGSGDAVFYHSFISGIAAGGIGSFCVTPLDCIKTRMQTIKSNPGDIQYKNVADAFLKILRYEGPRALFKGAACRMMVIAPLFGIAQTVYYVGVAEYLLGIKKTQHV